MVADTVCRCICGTGKRDPLDNATTWAQADVDLDELDESLYPLPKFTGRLSYSIYPDQQLRGQPMREGELWFLSTEDKVDPVNFSLYINGFSFWHDEQETVISLSPFSLVRNCKFQSTYPSLGSLSDFKIFKVSLFAQGRCYYFGVKGQDEHQAEEERSRWVLDISRAMRLVTQSLFPPYVITCEPLLSVASTQRRLMAGYLIHCDDGYVASVLYCELHPHCEDKAKMVLYENEVCQTPVMDVYITERSICCEKIGINCSCFSIEEHQFSTRSLSERKLWLRAISNLKVKLQNRAPTPTVDELRSYRVAIKEHIGSMKGSLDGQLCQTDALLQPSGQRKPGPPCPLSVPVMAMPPPGTSEDPNSAGGTGGTCGSLPLAHPSPQHQQQQQPPPGGVLGLGGVASAGACHPKTGLGIGWQVPRQPPPAVTGMRPVTAPPPEGVLPCALEGTTSSGSTRLRGGGLNMVSVTGPSRSGPKVGGAVGPRLAVVPHAEEVRQPGDG
mmetsp:Transcript_21535/g.73822  ORF Transcript_21535/g.73822 Transcript_21535/m.73822 type:complete len:500 (-) Transcript_21535:109-1608(-)